MTRPHYLPAFGPDPYDPSLRPALDHAAFYEYGEPFRGDVEDTGLRCFCGREVVSDMDDAQGWAHVGIGDRDEPVMEPVTVAVVSGRLH